MHLHIKGKVTSSVCRFEAGGKPVVVVEIDDVPTGQCIRVRHAYPDASHASGYAARALASRLRGQEAELDAINPRFKAKRMECDAAFIHSPDAQSAGDERKDLQ
jgi:hypothetical protein